MKVKMPGLPYRVMRKSQVATLNLRFPRNATSYFSVITCSNRTRAAFDELDAKIWLHVRDAPREPKVVSLLTVRS